MNQLVEKGQKFNIIAFARYNLTVNESFIKDKVIHFWVCNKLTILCILPFGKSHPKRYTFRRCNNDSSDSVSGDRHDDEARLNTCSVRCDS